MCIWCYLFFDSWSGGNHHGWLAVIPMGIWPWRFHQRYAFNGNFRIWEILEVPTIDIFGLYKTGLNIREYPHNSYGQKYGTFTYLHFRILKFPLYGGFTEILWIKEILHQLIGCYPMLSHYFVGVSSIQTYHEILTGAFYVGNFRGWSTG
jgi:hypothetical protein